MRYRLPRPKPAFERLISALSGHDNEPELHLLGEDGSRAVTGPMPCVTVLRARVNPYCEEGDMPNRKMLGLQELFFACPNLKSFSLAVHGNYGGCVRVVPRHPMVKSFELSGKETFPPLQYLSLDGYPMEHGEWMRWREGLNWSNLASLSLGPRPDLDRMTRSGSNAHAESLQLLKRLTSSGVHAKSLRRFELRNWAGEGRESCSVLKRFLASFETLEQLTVKGHFVPVRAVCNHTGLRRLCLHAIELPRGAAVARPTLGVAELSELDARCPHLEELELDIHRDSNGWVSYSRNVARRKIVPGLFAKMS